MNGGLRIGLDRCSQGVQRCLGVCFQLGLLRIEEGHRLRLSSLRIADGSDDRGRGVDGEGQRVGGGGGGGRRLIVIVGENDVVPILDSRVLQVGIHDRIDVQAKRLDDRQGFLQHLVEIAEQHLRRARQWVTNQQGGGGNALGDAERVGDGVDQRGERDIQARLRGQRRVERGHVDGRIGEIDPHALDDGGVHRRAAILADEVEGRLEQLAAIAVVEIHQRGKDRIGRRLGETGIGDGTFRRPVRHQHNALAWGDLGYHRICCGVDPLPGRFVVLEHDGAAVGLGDQVGHLHELGRRCRSSAAGGDQACQACREHQPGGQHGHGAIRRGGRHGCGLERAGGFGALVLLKLNPPVIGLPRGQNRSQGGGKINLGLVQVPQFEVEAVIGHAAVQIDRVDVAHQEAVRVQLSRGVDSVWIAIHRDVQRSRSQRRVLLRGGNAGADAEGVGALLRGIGRPQPLAGQLGADIEIGVIRVIGRHTLGIEAGGRRVQPRCQPQRGDIDLEDELQRLRRRRGLRCGSVEIEGADRRFQFDRGNALNGQAGCEPGNVDAKQIIDAGGVIGGRVQRAELQRDGRGFLQRLHFGEQCGYIEDQNLGGAEIGRVQLGSVAAQHNAGAIAAGDRARRADQHRVGERIGDDADLGADLVQIVVIRRQLRILVIDQRHAVVGDEGVAQVRQYGDASGILDVQIDLLRGRSAWRGAGIGRLAELRAIGQGQAEVVGHDRRGIQDQLDRIASDIRRRGLVQREDVVGRIGPGDGDGVKASPAIAA